MPFAQGSQPRRVLDGGDGIMHRTGADDDQKAIVATVQDGVNGVARGAHDARGRQGARCFAHHLFRRGQLLDFSDAKIVCRAQHGYGSCFSRTCRPNKKAARSGGCSDFLLQFVRLSAILPPPASCRS